MLRLHGLAVLFSLVVTSLADAQVGQSGPARQPGAATWQSRTTEWTPHSQNQSAPQVQRSYEPAGGAWVPPAQRQIPPGAAARQPYAAPVPPATNGAGQPMRTADARAVVGPPGSGTLPPVPANQRAYPFTSDRGSSFPTPVPAAGPVPAAPRAEPTGEIPADDAQETPPAKEPASGAEQSESRGTPELTIELVQGAIADVEASESYDAETKASHLKFLQQAVKWLESAAEAEKKRKQLEAEIEAVPTKLAELEQSLSAPPKPANPQVAPDATVAQLEQLLSQTESELQEAKAKLAEHEKLADPQGRADRKAELTKLTAKAKEQLAEVISKIEQAKSGGEAKSSDSQMVELKAKRIAVSRTVELHDVEKAWLDAHAEVFPKQRDLSLRSVSRYKKLVTAWQDVIARLRAQESERQAAEARRQVADSHPALREYAERNAKLAEERTELAQRLDDARTYLDSVRKTLETLQQDYEDIAKRVRVVGMTPAVGLILRNHRGRLPQAALYRERRKKNSDELQRVQLAMYELQTERSHLGDLDGAIEEKAAELATTTLAHLGPDRTVAMVRDIMKTRQDYIDKLLSDYDTYHDTLSDMEVVVHELVTQIEENRAYIDEHVLWIRSVPPLTPSDIGELQASFRRMLNTRSGLLALPHNLGELAWSHPAIALALVLGLAALVVLRIWLVRWLRFRDPSDARSWRTTVFQLAVPVLLVLPGPLTLCALASWMTLHPDQQAGSALSQALFVTAGAWLIAGALSNGFRRGGPAQTLLGFDGEASELVRKQLAVFQGLIVPAMFPLAWLAATQDSRSAAVLERTIFVAIQLGLAYLLHRILRPSTGVLTQLTRHLSTNWLSRLVPLWHLLGVGFPITLATLAVVGYYYTAWELLMRGLETVGLLVLAAGVYALGSHLRPIPSGMLRRHAAEADWVHRLEASWRSLLGGAISLLVLGGLWFAWADTLSALQILDRVELWTTNTTITQTTTNAAGESIKQQVPAIVPITLADLGGCVILLLAAVFAGRTVPALLNVTLVSRLPLDQGARHAIVLVSRYLVILVGTIAALRSIGVSWSSVQWLAAAMTVGLGFGLQEIFANLVSGLIILFERPIRMGDLVTVSGTTGRVTRMQIRATTITDFDRRELVVPNKKFITEDVVNWTLSDPVTRFVIPVGISYGSDPVKAHEILVEVAQRHPLVMNEPPPAAVFTSFGNSTLDLELRAFLPTRDKFPQVLHELNVAIEQSFREAGIEIAFPQQDIHIRSLPESVELVQRDDQERRAA